MDSVEILEVYVPARVEYLANLYVWLREQLYSRPLPLLHGFSIYEVNGAFRGAERVYEERTAVIRVVLDAPDGNPGSPDDRESAAHQARIEELATVVRDRITEQ
ncbi:MAG: hypothetical protein FLDDKLPJ_01698 [Phycisphaerae bacterium]|nr:hypothetical protein [Phycisphaerae bacterium]